MERLKRDEGKREQKKGRGSEDMEIKKRRGITPHQVIIIITYCLFVRPPSSLCFINSIHLLTDSMRPTVLPSLKRHTNDDARSVRRGGESPPCKP